MLDIVIAGGQVIDGTGNPWFRADLGISGGRIERIGEIAPAEAARILDARGLAVSPGFIDMHTHSDIALLVEPGAEVKIRQGVTTEVLGADGVSVAPVTPDTRDMWRGRLGGLIGHPTKAWSWLTFDEYLGSLERARTAVNVAGFVGHGTVRMAVMGLDSRPPSADELQRMRWLIRQAIEEGAFGLSDALIYAPAYYSSTSDIISLASAAAESGGIYMTHIRSESDDLVEALQEALEIGAKANLPVHISHHKAAGPQNWGKVQTTLGLMDEARARGVDITCDAYPYLAAAFGLDLFLPQWAFEHGTDPLVRNLREPQFRQRLAADMARHIPGKENLCRWGNWDGVLVAGVVTDANRKCERKSIAQIAQERGTDGVSAVFDLLADEKLAVAVTAFWGREEDVNAVLRHRTTMICSDGVFGGHPHPRLYGTFPRVLGPLVRDVRLFSMEEAVRKMTSLPAQRLGLRDRGLIRPGMWADLVVFDPVTVTDRSTYADPRQYPIGVEHVLVNGEIVVHQGVPTGARPGKALRHGMPS